MGTDSLTGRHAVGADGEPVDLRHPLVGPGARVGELQAAAARLLRGGGAGGRDAGLGLGDPARIDALRLEFDLGAALVVAVGGGLLKSRDWIVGTRWVSQLQVVIGPFSGCGVVDAVDQQDADGYLLVCSTQPSAALVTRLEALESKRPVRTHV